MCGGFTCSKNALAALNIMYILVACVLISVAVYGRASTQVTNLPIVGGIIGCGVLLIFISILGLFGAAKHHQVVLFFYMIVLFLLFLIQFGIACACLAVTPAQQLQLAEQGWRSVDAKTKAQVQETFHCCGFNGSKSATINDNGTTLISKIPMNDTLWAPACSLSTLQADCCPFEAGGSPEQCVCPPCLKKLESTIDYAFRLCGGIGMFFSFTEILAVLVAYRYRNLYDPFEKLPAANIPRNYLY